MTVITRELIGLDNLRIPRRIASCPICEAPIEVEFDEYQKREDGTWECTRAKPNCTTEPDIDSPEWDDWMNGHWSTPYVDWLPLEISLTKWVNQRYSFNVV